MYTISPLNQAEHHATISAERIAPFHSALLGAASSHALFWADLTYVNMPNVARKLNDTVDDRILNAVLNDQTVNADEQSES